MSDHAVIRGPGGDVVVQSTHHSTFGEIRITSFGGGPNGMELLVKVDAEGSELTIWNPYKRAWEILADSHVTR